MRALYCFTLFFFHDIGRVECILFHVNTPFSVPCIWYFCRVCVLSFIVVNFLLQVYPPAHFCTSVEQPILITHLPTSVYDQRVHLHEVLSRITYTSVKINRKSSCIGL